MASKPARRLVNAVQKQSWQWCTCVKPTSCSGSFPTRQFSASSKRLDEVQYSTERQEQPRWSYTPRQMMAPFHPRRKDPLKAYESNSDPAKLDRMYNTFLGRGGDKLLTEEIKWLAITHKSFDQGRRGFNDRLAFLGKRILHLQATITQLHSKSDTIPSPTNSEDGRIPYTDSALEGLEHTLAIPRRELLSRERLGGLGRQMGLAEVIRWKPRDPRDMISSGIDTVMTSTIYAIIGAIALQKGGDMAGQIARERVLKPLGVL
ncbi:ribonuclease-III-like-domain-containing protein [Xylogone sp. PMI_703]|nr:ribonuclease-III-like-domain-containing protein [Xylogone sp. PMI_703]